MLGILMLAPKAGSQEKTPISKIDTLMGMQELDNVQRLKPGYVVSIQILEDKREALELRVAPTGEMQVPYLGLIKAEGLTCRELSNQIKTELEKTFFKSATVLITSNFSQIEPEIFCSFPCYPDIRTVAIAGNVSKKGKHTLPNDKELTLTDLLELAGGITSHNKIPVITIVRRTPLGNKTIRVNAKAALLQKRKEYDLFLRRDDVVTVD